MMLKKGDVVKIRYSKELEEIKLGKLVNHKAIVTLPVYNDKGKCRGAYVIPRIGFLRKEEWYIPIKSIESDDTINSFRALDIIKKTIL